MSTTKTEKQSTEKKVKANTTNGAKKDQKTTATKKPETKNEFTKEDVPTIAKISFFGAKDDSSFVVNLSNGHTEVVQNDTSHDKLKNRIALMKNRGYHVVENEADRSITFEPDMKPEDVKSTLKDVIKEQLDRSNGKFYYMDFNKLSKGDMKRVTSGVDSSPDTPNEMVLFMIGCVLKLMAIGEVAEVTTQPSFVNSIRVMLDAIKCANKCISDELDIKPVISTSVEEVNGFGCRNCNNSRRIPQENDRVKEFVKHIDALLNMIDF